MSQVATAERHADDVQKPASGISLRVVFNAVGRHPIAFLGVVFLAVSAGLGIWFFPAAAEEDGGGGVPRLVTAAKPCLRRARQCSGLCIIQAIADGTDQEPSDVQSVS